MIGHTTIFSSPGATVLNDGRLAFIDIFKVKRQGISYDIILTGTPTGRQVLYENIGRLTFELPFDYDVDGIRGEPIYVLFNE